MNIKPALAEDAQLDKMQFPCWEQPKIDGVRALNSNGGLVGRSMDPFKGFGITEYFSKPEFDGLDGEMILGFKPNCTERLCSVTTGAMGRFKGVTEMPDLSWWVFDRILPLTFDWPYEIRYELLARYVEQLSHPRIKLVPFPDSPPTSLTVSRRTCREATYPRRPNHPPRVAQALRQAVQQDR